MAEAEEGDLKKSAGEKEMELEVKVEEECQGSWGGQRGQVEEQLS